MATCQGGAPHLLVWIRTQSRLSCPNIKEISIIFYVYRYWAAVTFIGVFVCICQLYLYSLGGCYITTVRTVEQIPFERGVNDKKKPVEAGWANTAGFSCNISGDRQQCCLGPLPAPRSSAIWAAVSGTEASCQEETLMVFLLSFILCVLQFNVFNDYYCVLGKF